MANDKEKQGDEHIPFGGEALPLHGPLTEAERERNERDRQESEYREHDRSYKERQIAIAQGQLTTNQKLTLLTALLVLLGFISNLVSFLTARAAQRSADAANSAADTASKTLNEMKSTGQDTKAQIDRLIAQQQRTADNGETSLKTLTKQFQLDQRPYMTIAVSNAIMEKGKPLQVNFEVRNVGRSPALNGNLHRHVLFGPAESEIRVESPDATPGNTVWPQGSVSITTATSVKNTFANESAVRDPRDDVPWDGNPYIIVFGRITYKDRFGTPYCTPFMMQYLIGGGMWESATGFTPITTGRTVNITDLCPAGHLY